MWIPTRFQRKTKREHDNKKNPDISDVQVQLMLPKGYS